MVTWKPDLYFVDGSGAKYSQDARLRRVGWSIACLKQNAEMKEACMGQRQGRQTVPRAELMVVVVLAENIETAGLYVVRVDAQFLQTSIRKV